MNVLSTPLLLSLIHASIVVSAALLLRFCIPQRFAVSRAAVGGLGLACVLLVTFLTFLPLPNILPASDGAAPTTLNVQQSADQSSKPAAGTPSPSKNQISAPATPIHRLQVSLELFHRLADGLGTVIVTANAAPPVWQNLLIGFLLLGALVGLCQIASSLVSIHRLYRTSSVVTDGRALELTADFQRRCRCQRTIELRETSALPSPATFGILKPVILLPVTWRQWSHDELASVLAHEIAHIHRGDFSQRLLSRTCAAVHFYHPLVYAAVRRLAIDQEYAADRLAGELHNNKHSYLCGLAKLALRFHDSFQDETISRRLSIMPNSSDFLARRLHMLRTKEGSPSKRMTKLISCAAIFGVVAIALATTLLRSSISFAERPARRQSSPRIASVPKAAAAPETPATKSDAKSAANQTSEPLFSRGKFDISFIHGASEGAAFVRFSEIFRHPEIAPLVDNYNKQLTALARENLKKNDISIDLRQIDWIAFTTCMKHKWVPASPEQKDKPGQGQAIFTIGTGYTYIHMAHPADWQQIVLQTFPGSKLEHFEGKSYVHVEAISVIGPVGGRLRFLDNQTMLIAGDPKPEEADESNKMFFDDGPRQQPYAWEDAWHAVEGGLITCIYDQAKSGWSDLPEVKRNECPPEVIVMLPLLSKTEFYALGWDCNENTLQTGIKLRATCADQSTAQQLHLAASLALNRWPELFKDNPENLEKYHARLIQFFSQIKMLTSTAEDNQHFLHATAEAALNKGELTDFVRWLFQ